MSMSDDSTYVFNGLSSSKNKENDDPTDSKVGMCFVCGRLMIREPYIVCALCGKTVCFRHAIGVVNGPEGNQMWCRPCYDDDIE